VEVDFLAEELGVDERPREAVGVEERDGLDFAAALGAG